MALEEDGDVRLLEDFGEDAGLLGRFRLKRGGYALDELFPWNRPAIARAEMGELPRFDVGCSLIGCQDYDVPCKRDLLCCKFINKLSRG